MYMGIYVYVYYVHVRPGAGSILATVKASSKLASRLEEVDVITANKVLGQVDDGGHQTLLCREIPFDSTV